MATDDLIAALQRVGRVDSEGSFSFDREKAREKLRTFQVAQPQRYVLHFIAVAVLKGATRIEVVCDSDDLIIRFDGAAITSEDLDDLYNASFAAAHSDVQRARQQLAVGIHSALALNPRHVRIVSGADGTGVSLLASHDAADVVGLIEDARGTQIHVKQRFRPGLMVRFVKHLRGRLAEATWLCARGFHATVPITLNGERVSAGLTLPGAQHCKSGADGHCRGVAGLVPTHGPGVIRLVRHGVWICDVVGDWLPPGLVVVIANDRLLTDLSGDKVVLDGEHARCLELARQLAAQVIDSAIGAGPAVDPDPALRERLHVVWRAWDGAVDPRTTIGAAMTRIVAWPDIWGRRHSFAALLAEARRVGHVATTSGEFFGTRVPPSDEIVLRTGDAFTDAVLALGLGDRLRDVTAQLEVRAHAEANRRRWRAQPCEPTLTAANYLMIADFGVQVGDRRIHGQAGLRRAPTERCHLRVIVDGCALAEYELDAPIAGVDVVLSGPLAISPDYSGPVRDALFAAALAGWAATSRVLVDAAVRRGVLDWRPSPEARTLVRGFIRAHHPSDALYGVLAAAGYEAAEIEAHVQALVPGMPSPAVPTDLVEQPWLRDGFYFTTAAGPTLSVGAVAVALAHAMPVACISDVVVPRPGLEEVVLRVNSWEKELLLWLFGDRVTVLSPAEYELRCAEADFMTRPTRPLALDPATHTDSVVVEQDALRVAMAFPRTQERWEAAHALSSCEIVRAGRTLTRVRVWSPVPGASFAIVGDSLTPRPDWDGVRLDDAFCAAITKATAAVPALVRAAIDGASEATDDDSDLAWRRGVLAALVAGFPSPQLRAAYANLLTTRGRERAEEQYLELLALGASRSMHTLGRAIEEHTADIGAAMDVRELAASISAPHPTRAQVEHVADVLREIRMVLGQAGGNSWIDRVTSFSPEVAALPLFRRVDGSRVTLAEAMTRAKTQLLHVYVDTGGQPANGYRRSLRVDPIMFEQLCCLFGATCISTAPPRNEAAERPAPRPEPRRLKSPPKQETEVDPPPSPPDLAALFAELEREADARPPATQPVTTSSSAASKPAAVAPVHSMPPPGPGERLVAAVQAELEALRRGHESLLTGFNLDHVRAVVGRGQAMVSIGGDGLVIDLAHPRVEQAMEHYASDRLWVSFLASRIYTALNVWREDIADVDEAAFHTRHLAWLHAELARQGSRETTGQVSFGGLVISGRF